MQWTFKIKSGRDNGQDQSFEVDFYADGELVDGAIVTLQNTVGKDSDEITSLVGRATQEYMQNLAESRSN